MKHIVHIVVFALVLPIMSACSAPLARHDSGHYSVIASPAAPSPEARPDSQSIQKYAQEEAFLVQILEYYERALAAHRDGDFNTAETLIDSAFVIYGKVDAGAIADTSLAAKLTSAGSSLVREYGQILDDSEQISEEASEPWLSEFTDTEKFKAGQWTDGELKELVAKISRKCDIPIDFNAKVRDFIYYFQNRGRPTMTTWLKRSGRYLPMIREIFMEEDLPLDLAYLCFNESGLNPKAVSRARAVGLWQFMPATGADYGLKRTKWVDERCDPVKSTRAAAKHLKRISGLYDDWNVVLAAYNWGEGRVSRSARSDTPDYWTMNLPRETENYVPIFMAILAIAKAPEVFGFENITLDPPFEYDTVDVRPGVRLKDAANCAGVDIGELRMLNSELFQDCTPPGPETYRLRIPKGRTNLFLAEYAKLPPESSTPDTGRDPEAATAHTIRKGDTLAVIAKRYGVTVDALARANRLKKSATLKVGRKLVLPGDAGTGENGGEEASDAGRAVAEKEAKTAASRSAGKTAHISGDSPDTFTYVVKNRDTLADIAAKYGVSHKDIMAWNNITSPRKIMVGTRLVIRTQR